MAKLEREYQPELIRKIKDAFPGSMALKLNSAYLPGVPDWLILYKHYWATLEVKKRTPTQSDWRPNQQYYIRQMNVMSFSACVYPENEQEVLDALQDAFNGRGTPRDPIGV